MNAQESHGWNLFAAQSWNMGISDHFKRNEIKRTLLDVLCLFWIPSSKYRKSKFHSKQMKHFASQIFLRSYPIFFSYALLSFFFWTALSSEAFWNWTDRMPKLLCTLETTQTILSTFHATADQQHCRERVLCSSKADMDLWNPIFKNYQKCFHGLFVAISLDQSIKVTLVIYEKERHLLPSRRLRHKCLATHSAYISVWATGWTFEALFQESTTLSETWEPNASITPPSLGSKMTPPTVQTTWSPEPGSHAPSVKTTHGSCVLSILRDLGMPFFFVPV